MKASTHKIIITGTGRAGTTFLVRLFTELGLDTGYTRDNWRRDYFAHCNAGLEHKLTEAPSPYVVKDPELCKTLGQVLTENRIVIDHALIPVRDLDAAASSRIRVGGADGSVPGGLRETSDPTLQKAILAERFHQLTVTLAMHDIPHTFLLFPRFVRDPDYAFTKLRGLFPFIDRERFGVAFNEVAEPSLVHTFTSEKSAPACDVISFQAAQRRKRLWRRIRRLVGWSAVAASFALNINSHWTSQTVLQPLLAQPMTVAASASPVPQPLSHGLDTPSKRLGPLSAMPSPVSNFKTSPPFFIAASVPYSLRMGEEPVRPPMVSSSAADAPKFEPNSLNPRVD